MNIRVGFGFDVHRLVPGRALWLGGIRLEHETGLLGHSDADVLIHAICGAPSSKTSTAKYCCAGPLPCWPTTATRWATSTPPSAPSAPS